MGHHPAVVDHKDGVDMKAPPSSLPWETLAKKPKKVPDQPTQETLSNAPTTQQLLRQLLSNVVTEPTPTPIEAQPLLKLALTDVVASRLVGMVPMVEYLKFLSIPNIEKVLHLSPKKI
ncbi:hypothetical protein Pst134EA_015841 [Puccinia striiformis f. sp. tritici]|uniref:Uncharacterized protein n=1 Tax=Puccinia striiformis f. sp. tritici PST-78 TaxID=1165861 RepID=A0A0L0VLL8_9BASI|nr:hypothetical protein Pst134EA_015841 [Puccinia striiformis f. sp. tritici]KAH9463757.1 hypothetical protein Pst134EA_015841 [Puccinia striiformis f. sp. tritici]KNF00107.1 hypothetical protein PSTG_06728 [Puccinia striiformis f. sp. tritici PST-78]